MNLRILVVEDNPVVAGMIRHFLDKSDYTIAGIVTTGEEAVAVAGESTPDLILMDVLLAGRMDGIEAAAIIWRNFQIPVVFLTGTSGDETICRAASAEAYGYLNKPVQERELVSTIEITLAKHRAEIKLKENEKWLETTLYCIADAVIAADSVGCVKLINPAAEALTGWKRDQAVGRELMEVFRILDVDTRWPSECQVARIIDGVKQVYRFNPAKILVARDGTETIVDQSAAAITNDRGDIIGVVLVFRSILQPAYAP
jgi:two-component system cell cycle sensor histidine kinase/response regulator CckA